MKKFALVSALCLLAIVTTFGFLKASSDKTGQLPLPTSKLLLEPVPGNPQPTNSFPAAVALSPDGKYLALLCDGYGTFDSDYSQSIAILDLATNNLTDFPDPRLARKAHQTYFYGVAFSHDGRKIYASMSSMTDPLAKRPPDTGSGIAVYDFQNGNISPSGFIPLAQINAERWKQAPWNEHPHVAPDLFPAGLAAVSSGSGEQLLVADNLGDSAYLVDPVANQINRSFRLSDVHPQASAGNGDQDNEAVSYPLAVLVTKDGQTGYASLWNQSAVSQFPIKGGAATTISLHAPSSPIAPGSHPNAVLLSPDEKRLYVALANTDEVAVIDRASRHVFYLSTKLPGQKYGGNFPISLAITPDGNRLFVANASSDAIAVFDHPQRGSKPTGFIPTEWYPTALAIANGELFVATGKGHGTGPNKGLMGVVDGRQRTNYIASLLHGSIARIPLNQIGSNLSHWTDEVMAGNLMRGNSDSVAFHSGKNPIKHVIYIIKENRSYDQVLGDIGIGDSDPSLTMYGEKITPNEHKLARQFGLIDNFYDSGEVSGDGHVWSTAAITTDYEEQTWEINYRSDERTYDFEGMVHGQYPLEQKIPDVNEPDTGYLWGNLARHKITYRHYGEFISTDFCGIPQWGMLPTEGTPIQATQCARNFIKPGEPLPDYLGQPHGSPSPWKWDIPLIAKNIPTKPELVGHFDPRFPDFNLSFPDQLRADEFMNEFDAFVSARKSGHDTMPQFILLRFPNDHTSGTKPGIATPNAAVADNDLAVGRLVEAVSHSPYWQDTAILILEDDAQNGADHVDAHRSTAYVISRFSPAPQQGQTFVDHTFYTTVNMVHTIEALLGVPPMNNNDSQAAVMSPMFSGNGDQPPFTADTSNRDSGMIYQINPPKGPDAATSSKLDFSHADAADAGVLNAILWRNTFGSRPLPKTPGAQFK